MQNFNQFLKEELNKPQLKAVTHSKGSTIVIAGAGSGKTRVITARIANLIINENTNPKSIVALTFTNKAAGEMKERLINFLGTNKNLPFVGTFHSYCLLLLRSNPTLLQHPEFTILDADDQKSLIKKILKKHGLEKQFSVYEINYQISNIKNKFNLDIQDDSLVKPILKEIYSAYESEKNSSHSLDFDDLILEILKSFQNNPTFKNNFHEKIKHVLVDEYQDTNAVQHELLKNMALNSKKNFTLDSICAVGDEDQSIYSWRGAIATNMIQFQKDFKPVTKIKIEQNYRTVKPILEAANSVISNNKNRTNKILWSDKNAKNRILNLICRSSGQEAYTIANIISSISESSREQKLSNIAIFYRTHFQSRSIEEALIQNSIPYKIVGGIRFYERKEIKDLLAYLRLVVNPFDRASLFRIINLPARGLGQKFEEKLYEELNKNSLLNFKQILKILQNTETKTTTIKYQNIENFLNIFKELDPKQTPSQVLEKILQEIEYLNYLTKTFDEKEANTKKENVKEFLYSIRNFERKTSQNNLSLFIQEISLMQEKIENKANVEDQVQCMTLHSAKGLEFNYVIISGIEEGILPSYQSLKGNKELEEERRLFYVGITRAKERLILLNANFRNTYGQINDQVVSRFLEEIPTKLITKINISQMHDIQVKSHFNNWIGKQQNASNLFTFKDFAPKTSFSEFKPTKFVTPKKPFLNSTPWKKNQPVKHKKFGIGIIKKIEKKVGNEYYITASFKCGEKKLLSSFLSPI
ncbi:ATP-dependent helicase [Candidatus Dependentiae bacterium]